jgi:hypothetical protein
VSKVSGEFLAIGRRPFKKQNWPDWRLASAIRNRSTRRAIFNLAYDRPVFNGLLFIWGTFRI